MADVSKLNIHGNIYDLKDSQARQDLLSKADINQVPTKTSELTNDSGFITSSDIPSIPTKTSELTNDSGFITSSDIPTIPTKTSELTNDSNFVTSSDVATSIASSKTWIYIGEDTSLSIPSGAKEIMVIATVGSNVNVKFLFNICTNTLTTGQQGFNQGYYVSSGVNATIRLLATTTTISYSNCNLNGSSSTATLKAYYR